MSLIPISPNIGRSEADYNTNTPFMFGCSRKIGQITLPEGVIQCVRIECTEDAVPPLRIASASVVPDRMDMVSVEFADAEGRTVGIWYAWFGGGQDRCSDFITRPSGALAGHIVYDPVLPGMLLAAARVSGGTIKAASGALVLMPQCLYSGVAGHAKTITAGEFQYHGDVAFDVADDSDSYLPGEQPAVTGSFDESDSALSLNLNQETTGNGIEYGITRLVLQHDGTTEDIEIDNPEDKYPIRHILLQHTLASNLRIVTNGGVISFTGVKDG